MAAGVGVEGKKAPKPPPPPPGMGVAGAEPGGGTAAAAAVRRAEEEQRSVRERAKELKRGGEGRGGSRRGVGGRYNGCCREGGREAARLLPDRRGVSVRSCRKGAGPPPPSRGLPGENHT